MKAHWGVWGTTNWKFATIWFPQYISPINHFDGRPILLLLNHHLCNHGQWAIIKMYHVYSMYFRPWSLKSNDQRIKTTIWTQMCTERWTCWQGRRSWNRQLHWQRNQCLLWKRMISRHNKVFQQVSDGILCYL